VLFLKNKDKIYFCPNLKQYFMSDNLDYIRKAVAQSGKYGRAKVLRYETNRFTGMQENPVEIEVNAAFALDQLSKPFNKRSHNYKKIRPIGEKLVSGNNYGLSNLDSPELVNKIKEQAKAELEAELRAKIEAEYKIESGLEEKPKRKKKSEDSDIQQLDSL
jgi:hypothetical protein